MRLPGREYHMNQIQPTGLRVINFKPNLVDQNVKLSVVQRRNATYLALDVSSGYDMGAVRLVFNGNPEVGEPYEGGDVNDLIEVAYEHIGSKTFTAVFAQDGHEDLLMRLMELVEVPDVKNLGNIIFEYGVVGTYVQTYEKGGSSIKLNPHFPTGFKPKHFDFVAHSDGTLEITVMDGEGRVINNHDVFGQLANAWRLTSEGLIDRKTILVHGNQVVTEVWSNGAVTVDYHLVKQLVSFQAGSLAINTGMNDELLVMSADMIHVAEIKVDSDGGVLQSISNVSSGNNKLNKVFLGSVGRYGTYVTEKGTEIRQLPAYAAA